MKKKWKRTARLVVAPKNATRRACLKCGAHFPSAGPWNRICPHCDEVNSMVRDLNAFKVWR